MIYSKAKISPKGTVNKKDIKRWLNNLLVFVAPVALIYLMQVQGALSQEGHFFTGKDFIPSSFTQGAMVLYTINSLIDIIRKFRDGSK